MWERGSRGTGCGVRDCSASLCPSQHSNFLFSLLFYTDFNHPLSKTFSCSACDHQAGSCSGSHASNSTPRWRVPGQLYFSISTNSSLVSNAISTGYLKSLAITVHFRCPETGRLVSIWSFLKIIPLSGAGWKVIFQQRLSRDIFCLTSTRDYQVSEQNTYTTKIMANKTISGKDKEQYRIVKHWPFKIVFTFQRHGNQDCAIPSKFLCLPNPRDREPPAEERDRSVQLSKELHKPRSTTIDQQRLCKTKDLIWTGQQSDNVMD